MPWYDDALRGLKSAFNSGDFALVAEWIHEDAVFDWSRSISDNSGIHHGRESMRAAFDDFVATWDHVQWEVDRIDELGHDRVLVSTTVKAQPRGTDNTIEASGAQLLDFRDGKITQATLFQGRDQALAAEGGP